MFEFIKQRFIILVLVLLGFGGSLATKCLSMNNQLRVVRHVVDYFDFSSDQLHYYPFINIQENCDGSYITIEDPFGRSKK